MWSTLVSPAEADHTRDDTEAPTRRSWAALLGGGGDSGPTIAIGPLNDIETVITRVITFTYVAWLTGLLYMAGPVLGWYLAWKVARAYYLSPILPEADRPMPLPAVLWAWPICMLWLLVVLFVGHFDWDLGAGQTIKSAVGWAKGWALIALFPLAGYALPIRLEVLSRAVCRLARQSLILLPIFLVSPFIGIPEGRVYVSPLEVLGGGDRDFFAVVMYTLEPGVGTPRWQFFTPWSPAAGMVAVIHFLLAREDPSPRWRWTGYVMAVLMAVLSTSRMALIALAVMIPLAELVGRLRRVSTFAWAAPIVLVASWIWPEISDMMDRATDAFNGARADSSRVRKILGHIAYMRWQNEAYWFGHGTVQRGPHPVEYMPIGSHHSWYGLLFVKGLMGAVGFAIPMVWTLISCAIAATRDRAGRLALAMILTYWFYSFGENLEVLTYLAWPALLTIGIALRMQRKGELSALERLKLARWLGSGADGQAPADLAGIEARAPG